MKKFIVILMAIALSWGMVERAAAYIYLSTTTEATLGGLTFQPEDVARYDPGTNTASLFFDGSAFSLNEDIVAVSVRDNGNIVLATEAGATLGGLTFGADDLVEYNPNTNTASLYFDGSSIFALNEDIDAASVLPNGNLILSTESLAAIGAFSFEDGDLVEYDFNTKTATLFFSETLFSLSEDIDAVSVLSNGNIVLSTLSAATLGGLTFDEDDLAEYNPITGIATLYFDGANFSTGENIDAVSVVVPIPGAVWLLFSGLVGLAGWRKKTRK